MKKTVCLLLLGAFLLAFTACGGKDSIVGTWLAEEGAVQGEFVFNDDGTGKVTINGVSVDSEWSVNDKGLLTVKISTMDTKYDAIANAEFSIKKDKLTVTSDGKQIVMTRKK